VVGQELSASAAAPVEAAACIEAAVPEALTLFRSVQEVEVGAVAA
jgi:hypothetical protein